MNMHTEKPSRRFVWWFALIFLSLGLAGIFAFGLQAFVAALIRPLAILFWFIHYVLPEVVVWAVVAILGAVLAMRARWGLRARRSQWEGGKAPVSSTENKGVASIADLIRQAEVSGMSRDILGRQLGEVAVALLCRRRCISPGAAWQLIYREEWPIDRRVYGILFPQQPSCPAKQYFQDLEYAVRFLEDYDRGGINDNQRDGCQSGSAHLPDGPSYCRED